EPTRLHDRDALGALDGGHGAWPAAVAGHHRPDLQVHPITSAVARRAIARRRCGATACASYAYGRTRGQATPAVGREAGRAAFRSAVVIRSRRDSSVLAPAASLRAFRASRTRA